MLEIRGICGEPQRRKGPERGGGVACRSGGVAVGGGGRLYGGGMCDL